MILLYTAIFEYMYIQLVGILVNSGFSRNVQYVHVYAIHCFEYTACFLKTPNSLGSQPVVCMDRSQLGKTTASVSSY